MARIRTIKPEFYRHEGLQDLEVEHPGSYSMLVFSALWGHCDKLGRFEWKPRTLKLDILPFLNFDMAATLELLVGSGFIRCYCSEGKEYGEIASFEKHQRIGGKEAQEPGKYPEPIEYTPEKDRGSIGEASGKQLGLQEGKGREGNKEGKGKEINVQRIHRREQVSVVFDCWRQTMNHGKSALDEKRRRLIEARLADGYTVESLCKAIRGCSKSAFHMGDNERGARYDGIDLILRDGSKVDQFSGYDDNPPKPQGKQAHLEAINRGVVDEFVNGSSGDEGLVIEGERRYA